MIHPGQQSVGGYADLAALLREEILSGRLAPGAALPSDRYLQQTYGLGRDTVRDAINVLRSEGLVVRRQGQASRVRSVYPMRPIDMTGVARVDVRMPSPTEREDLHVEVGVPVWDVVYVDGRREPLPGDRWYVPGPAAS